MNDFTQGDEPVQIIGPKDLAPTIALFSSVLLAFLFSWVDWQPIANKQYDDWILQSLSIASPFFAALGLGVFRKVSRPAYLLLGFVAGCGGFAQMLVLYALGRLDRSLAVGNAHGGYTIALPADWYVSLLCYPIVGSVCCLVGGMLGGNFALLGSRKAQGDDSNTTPNPGMPSWLQKVLVTFLTAVATAFAGKLVNAVFGIK